MTILVLTIIFAMSLTAMACMYTDPVTGQEIYGEFENGVCIFPGDIVPTEPVPVPVPEPVVEYIWIDRLFVKATFKAGEDVAVVDTNGSVAKIPLNAAVMDDGGLYVPLRDAGELLGFKVGWDNDKWSAILTKDGNLTEVKADAEGAKLVGGRVFVNKAALMEALRLVDGDTIVAKDNEITIKAYFD